MHPVAVFFYQQPLINFKGVSMQLGDLGDKSLFVVMLSKLHHVIFIAYFILAPLYAYNEFQQKISRQSPDSNITPIPIENLNPRITEFRRIDTSNDGSLSFTEFIMGDRQYIEEQSRRFHQLDRNADGVISRKEYENGSEQGHNHMDNFFRQLSYPNDGLPHYFHHEPFFSFTSHQMPQFQSLPNNPQQNANSQQATLNQPDQQSSKPYTKNEK